jgi:hypothetical protein
MHNSNSGHNSNSDLKAANSSICDTANGTGGCSLGGLLSGSGCDEESKGGLQWLVFAGLFAVCFSLFLVWCDHRLSTSTGERDLANTLRELRSAQAGLPATRVDGRQTH